MQRLRYTGQILGDQKFPKWKGRIIKIIVVIIIINNSSMSIFAGNKYLD
jgi:hypothetical protein